MSEALLKAVLAWVEGGPAPDAADVAGALLSLQDKYRQSLETTAELRNEVARLQAKRPPSDDAELAPGVIRFKNMARLRAEGVQP